ncbi:MAG: TolC family outer membrane protein [Burkholderiaceae bacterium]|nr:TolC family outer membrane protein [Burkholderiaceae bacterium]
MNIFRRLPPLRQLLPLTLALTAAGMLPAQAQSLSELYQSARTYDAAYQSALSQSVATLAKGEQAKAGVWPVAGLQAGVGRTNLDVVGAPSTTNYGTQNVTLSASQPIYRPGNWASYAQGSKQAAVAQAQLTAAEQDLIVRTSQTYFDVLAALDSLTFVQAQKAAVAEQLASAKRNFEVGTSTITDTREAQARYDLVIAQEIAAENDVRVKKIALDQLVGKSNTEPKALLVPVNLPPLVPSDVTTWVAQTETGHPGIEQARLALEVAKLETSKAQAGHQPTLDLNVSYGANRNLGTSTSTTTTRSNAGTVGLSLNFPLFAGFAVQNRVKETLALEEKAQSDLDGAKRSVAQTTRAAFYGVQTGLSTVKAFEAAEASSQSALDANKLGYQVGVRINIDVLNSQSQLFQTKRDLAKARYDVLLGGLKLRQANGTLKADDLAPVNALLAK